MGKSLSIMVNGILFPTKTALASYVRYLIGRYPVGCDVEGSDRNFCLALFEYHPDAASKLASGVNRIEVRLDTYGNKHFQLHRQNESEDDISWHWCVRHAK